MKKLSVAISVIVVIFVLIMASPVMSVKETVVLGNKKFSSSEILEQAGFENNVNIFAFSPVAAEEGLYKNTYIKHVNIKKDYMKRILTVEVIERNLSGYIKFDGNTYLYIDKEGMVLECRTSFTERRPVIEGLAFTEFTLGDYLKLDNTEAFDTLVNLSNLFEKFEIEHDIIRVDLSRADEIHFYFGNIDIQMGSKMDLDLKVRTVKEILPTLEEYKDIGGILYMQNPLEPLFKFFS